MTGAQTDDGWVLGRAVHPDRNGYAIAKPAAVRRHVANGHLFECRRGCGLVGASAEALPRLIGYQFALDLVRLVAPAPIRDARLREHARKSAASAALNTAEGAARQSRADKSRIHGIALAEAYEAVAAVEIAGALGGCTPADEEVLKLGVIVKNVLSRLVRRAARGGKQARSPRALPLELHVPLALEPVP